MNPMRLRNRERSTAAARRAFTLIELLLVLVILAVLAAVVVPKFTGRSEDAKIKATQAEITIIDSAIDRFEIDTGRLPSTDEGVGALIQAPPNVTNWKGPYLKKGLPKDQWNNPYVYRYPGQHNPDGFDLYSMGPDGRDGNDDITNWATQQ